MLTIRVLCFAQIKEALGRDETVLDIPEGSSAQDAVRILFREHGASKKLDSLPLRYAVNGEFRPESTELSSGDLLAPIPPVAGG